MNTPVKKVKGLCDIDVNNQCRVCSVNISISGRGKFNLFDGKASKEQNIATRLSLVLGHPLQRSEGVSSCICNKCRRELDKIEKYQTCVNNFKHLGEETLRSQSGRAASTTRVKRCYRSSPSSAKSPLRKKNTLLPRKILHPANLNTKFQDVCSPRPASSVEVSVIQ